MPVEPLVLVCGTGALVAAVLFLVVARARGARRAFVVTGRVALAGAILAVLTVTLTGGSVGVRGGVNLTPGAGVAALLHNLDTSLGVLNIVGNVLMFVPIGALTFWSFSVRWWTAAACGAGMSLLVELGQLTLGRSADVDDVLLNSCGATVGAVVAALATYLVTRGVTSPHRRRFAATSTDRGTG